MLHCSHLYLMTKSWSGCFRWKCLARVWVEGNLVHHVKTTWVGTEQGLMRTTNSNYKFLDSRDIHRMDGPRTDECFASVPPTIV